MELSAKDIQKYSKHSVAELKKKAQTIFNAWIRKRDVDVPCISCGGWPNPQAGHYMSAGHHSALRFDEHNVNRQCLRCNSFLHGNLINYRRGLIKKIGVDAVERLENFPKSAHKWDRLSLISIILKYK